MSHERAISILREFAGRQFDPRVVEVFTGVANDQSADGWPAGLAALGEATKNPEPAEMVKT
jgi:hypothetical protein